MQRKYKLFVADIDGTLTNGAGLISDADFQAVQELKLGGVKIAVCISRAARGCVSVLEKFKSDDFHIFF